MYIEIEIPVEYTSLEQKCAHIQAIYEWGLDNLEDQEQWKYFEFFKHKITTATEKIELYIENETDGLAIKLTWS